ncbi:MAG: SpoIIE family protein phosphatase [Bacteroidales bacterium]|nr:SpoIIE family protein phosphatase [Bacteroidales bacterium]
MISSSSSTRRLKLSNFKLNSLLDITQAINENLSVDELLNRYQKILCEDLNIGKVLIFMFSDNWHCILKSNIEDGVENTLDVEKDLIKYEEISFVTASQNPAFENFDIVIPVYNNNVPIAFVLIGDIEEGEGVSPTIKHLHFIQTLSNIIVVAIENIRLFNESLRQEAIKKELELASRMQSMLIPNKHDLPNNKQVSFTAFYHPHLDVGGDYYDVIELDRHEVGFCIADVSGKGISAALLMSNFQANLRALFTHEISLAALVEKLNKRVMASANGEKFITLFVAKYNYKTKELEYINAAHNPPIIYQANSKKTIKLSNGCVGMGMLDDIPVIKKGIIAIERTHQNALLYRWAGRTYWQRWRRCYHADQRHRRCAYQCREHRKEHIVYYRQAKDYGRQQGHF